MTVFVASPLHAVRIATGRTALHTPYRFEIEDAAGEHVRRDDVELLALLDAFALQAQQRQAASSGRRPLAVGHVNGRVAVVVALDEPLEPQVDQRRRLDEELAGRDRTAGRGGGHNTMPEADTNHDRQRERE